MKISIETEVNAPLRSVWNAWVTPEDITRWNFATNDWYCPKAELQRPGWLSILHNFKSYVERKGS